MFHLTPLEQIYPLKKFEVGLQTLPLPHTPYIDYEKDKKLKILSTPQQPNVTKMTIFDQISHLGLKMQPWGL